MFNWILRGIVTIAGVVASWFITRDAPQFGVMQMAVVLLLIVFIVAVVAFWPEGWRDRIMNRIYKPR